MIFKKIFILLLLNYLNFIICENVVRPIFQFIIANEALCGDPFIDSQWLPALEDCQIDCDISAQICQERTDKTFPGQRCINLPLGCKDRIKKMLNLDPDIPALQLPLAPLTTLPPSNSFKQQSENDINESEAEMPGMEPQMPIAVPFAATVSPFLQNNNILQPPITKSFRDSGYSVTAAPAYEPMPPSYHTISEFENSVTDSPSMQHTEYYPSAPETSQYINNAVTFPSTTMPVDYEDERNIETESKLPFNWEEATTESRFENKNGEFLGRSSNQNYEDYDTTMPSSYRMSMMGSAMSRPKNPWSWKDLEYKLKSRPFYSVDQSGNIEDFTPNCCQWALDGLCDRSWQRIRQLCPKSCGTVICTTIEGGLSCNRAIDVDVLDCFQRRRFYMLHAAPLNYPPRNYHQPRTNRPPFNHRQKTTPKDSSMFRAYAIENEIKGFRSGFK